VDQERDKTRDEVRKADRAEDHAQVHEERAAVHDEARDQARLDAQARFEAHRDTLRDMMQARGEYANLLDRRTRDLIRERARLNAEEQARIDAELAAGQPIPPWAMSQVVFLPQSLNSYYGYPDYYRIGVLGNNTFVYNSTSGEVLDIIRNLLGI